MRVPLRLLTGIALVALVTGCSGSVGRDEVRKAGGSITGLEVTGTPGTAPVVRMAPPLKLTQVRSETVVEGTGPVLGVDELVVLRLTKYDARTGKKLLSSYDRPEGAVAEKSSSLAPDLSEAIVGQRQGSRVVLALPAGQAFGDPGPVVLIADIVAVPPAETLQTVAGTMGTPTAALPRVVVRDGVPSRLDFGTAGTKPADLVVEPLIEGDGPRVQDESLVTLRSIGQVWGRRTPFDDTFAKEPILVPVGVGTMVRAWDRALVGVRRGSRLLVIAPPEYAFGDKGLPPMSIPPDATICYVIDVLGVSP